MRNTATVEWCDTCGGSTPHSTDRQDVSRCDFCVARGSDTVDRMRKDFQFMQDHPEGPRPDETVGMFFDRVRG